MYRLLFFLCAATLYLASSAAAQAVDTDTGKIEFIGLKKWTTQALIDSLVAINPDRPLYACAADLRFELGFPDASVIGYQDEDGSRYWVITVIEPQHADRVQYRPIPVDTSGAVEAWRPVAEQFVQGPMLHAALQSYGYILKGQPDSARARVVERGLDPEQVEPLWSFLQEHNTHEDRDVALWTLSNCRDYKSRTVAAALLANFPDSDLVWWHLLGAFRDQVAPVTDAAMLTIGVLTKHAPRKVNWLPAAESIRYILSGTNLFAYWATLDLLMNTGFPRELSGELLHEDTHDLLLAYLQAEHESSRQKVERFLAYMSGKEYDDYEGWKSWLESLRSP